ncbi:hypothetical protein ACRAKI_15180 [Saccharothrix isguenensis]
MDTDHPYLDEHSVRVPAPPMSVWRSLAAVMTRSPAGSSTAMGLLLATEPRRAAGTPFEVGSTITGFAVTAAVPGRLVELTGRHRFSRYRLVMTMEEQSGGTLLSARSYARFPGPHGFVYRQLVVGTGAHRLVVAGLLRSVRRHAQKNATPGSSTPENSTGTGKPSEG